MYPHWSLSKLALIKAFYFNCKTKSMIIIVNNYESVNFQDFVMPRYNALKIESEMVKMVLCPECTSFYQDLCYVIEFILNLNIHY